MFKSTEFHPLFPSISQIKSGSQLTNTLVTAQNIHISDASYSYEIAIEYLTEISANKARFNTSRTWINILFNYMWFIEKISICDIGRIEFRRFMEFSYAPPESLISKAPYTMFLDPLGESANPSWRPFVNKNLPHPYRRTDGSVKAQLSILSSLFGFFYDADYIDTNPASMYLKRTNLKGLEQINVIDEDKERSLSDKQWEAVWETVVTSALNDPQQIRTKFLMAMLFILYLRVSELSARVGYEPTMNLFSWNRKGWYSFYVPRSKYGRSRHVMCPPSLIELLKEYRLSLGLSEFPTPNENYPLFPRITPAYHGRKHGEINATLGKERIQEIVKSVFKKAYEKLAITDPGEAEDLLTFSSHSIRHTGIVADLDMGRSEKDVMAEAGHQSLATLSKYAKTNTADRYRSSINKQVIKIKTP